jgi:Flp pilus assembly protein TadG
MKSFEGTLIELTRRAARFPGRLWRDRRGSYSIVVAIMLPVLAGFTSLGTEVGLWMYTHMNMQAAADASAFTAATGKRLGEALGTYQGEARAVAGSLGFPNGSNNTSVAVNNPPTLGTHAGDAAYVEVVISQIQTQLFSKLLTTTPITISARSVGTVVGSPGNGCVLALDPAHNTGVTVSSGATVTLNSCSLYDDASGNSSAGGFALTATSGAKLTAASFNLVGTSQATSGASFVGTINTGTAALTDPYASESSKIAGPGSTCSSGATATAGHSVTISAGTYCNMTVTSGSTLTLNSGIYYFTGPLNVSSGATLKSNGGVTIVLTALSGNSCALLTFSSGSTVNLTALSSGPTAGLAIVAPATCATQTGSIASGSASTITGAIDLPTYNVTYSSGAGTGTSGCTQLIAFTITLSSGAGFANNCSGTGVSSIGGGQTSALVE